MTDRKLMELAAGRAPHMTHPDSVRSMMLDMLTALLPAFIWGVYSFGFDAVLILLVSVLTAVAAEVLFELAAKRRVAIDDLSSVVTGVLLAFLMPAGVPLYVVIIASAFAILIVKCAFGGLGCNILNPALAGFVFVKFCFPDKFVVAGDPLAALKSGDIPDIPLFDMLVGNIPGGVGEVSALLLFAGGVYIIMRGVADWRVPLSFLGTVAAITLLLPQNINGLGFMGYELFSGSLMLVAIFMATDPVTSPVTKGGRLIYGILCGGLTVLLRYYGRDTEGVVYAVLTMNLFAGLIDRIFFPPKNRAGGKNEQR